MATVVSIPPTASPSSLATSSPPVAPPPPLLLRKFTVDEYHRMANSGVFIDGDPFELLEGWIVRKMTRNTPHEVTIAIMTRLLLGLLPDRWDLRVQLAATTADSEPEPDFAVVRGQARDYLPHHPYPNDIGLLIEVADSSLDHDRTVKGRVYARAGISPYWIVNLIDAQVEVYSGPSGNVAVPAYQQLQTYRPGQAVPFVLDGQQIAAIPVQDLLP